jgi:N-methylhydantoinase B
VVSPVSAERDYGVVIAGGAVDEPATERLRSLPRNSAHLAATPPGAPGAEFGPERQAWESVFDLDSVDRLVNALFDLPLPRRYPTRATIYADVLNELPPGFPKVAATPEQTAAAGRVLRSHLDTL